MQHAEIHVHVHVHVDRVMNMWLTNYITKFQRIFPKMKEKLICGPVFAQL